MTRVIVGHVLGEPECYAIESIDCTDPRAGEVRIAIRATGVSYVDVLIASGGYQLKPPLPYTPGTEFAGVIDAVGEGVDPARIGQRVCASGFGRGFAESAIMTERQTLAIPDAMPSSKPRCSTSITSPRCTR